MAWFILGAGKSGKSAATHLARKGEDVLLSDPNLSREDAADLVSHGVTVTFAKQTPDLLSALPIEGFVPSPGVPPDHVLVQAAKNRNISFHTDIDLALREFSGTVVAVTGTNGKSTSVAMITHIATELGDSPAVACGNFGYPILSALHEQPGAGMWVIELSSYQLTYSQPVQADAVLLTSYSKDHLAWHKTEESYFAAKWRLVAANTRTTPIYADTSFRQAASRFGYQWPAAQPQPLAPLDKIRAFMAEHAPNLVAAHDQQNGWFASQIVAKLLQVDPKRCAETLRSFKTLPHRFEVVGTVNGFPLINDSKATNIDATCRSLASLTEPCTLLLGGLGKGESYRALLPYSDRVKRVVCFGAEGERIANELGNELTLVRHGTLKEVLQSFPRDWLDAPLLFSPGCASFDEFKNFEERGDYFRKWVADASFS